MRKRMVENITTHGRVTRYIDDYTGDELGMSIENNITKISSEGFVEFRPACYMNTTKGPKKVQHSTTWCMTREKAIELFGQDIVQKWFGKLSTSELK